MPLRRGTTIFLRMSISFRRCFEMNQLKMYSTNTTDNQWQVIEKNINVQERKKILADGQYRRDDGATRNGIIFSYSG